MIAIFGAIIVAPLQQPALTLWDSVILGETTGIVITVPRYLTATMTADISS